MQEVIKMAAKTKDMELQEVEKQEIVESGAERTRARKAFVPRADIYETDDELVVVADMPGVDENSVEVTLEKNVLTITGNVDLVQPENFSLAYAEYEEGDYERSFTLSNEIDLNSIEATVKDGVLRLHLPKIGEAKTKKIAVKAA
jgi:HSP20 family molecular chaperone IbpA